MRSVKCELVEKERLINTRQIKNSEDMVFYFDMFGGKKYVDVTQQYNDLIKSAAPSSQQVYELYCSYFKFGEMEQEKKTITATLLK
jgi:hypothetical protein